MRPPDDSPSPQEDSTNSQVDSPAGPAVEQRHILSLFGAIAGEGDPREGLPPGEAGDRWYDAAETFARTWVTSDEFWQLFQEAKRVLEEPPPAMTDAPQSEDVPLTGDLSPAVDALPPLMPDFTVRGIQQRLAALAYFEGEETGRLDEETVAALGQFQTDAGLEPTGFPDPTTRAVLARRIP